MYFLEAVVYTVGTILVMILVLGLVKGFIDSFNKEDYDEK